MEKAVAAYEEPITLFDRIVNGELPCDKLYEDDFTLAFRDLSPVAKTHFLVIPKDRNGLSSLFKAEERHIELMGRLLLTASIVAQREGLEEGYRTVINTGKNAGQTVYHIHVHVIGGESLGWPPVQLGQTST